MSASMPVMQLDLFGEVERSESARAEREAQRESLRGPIGKAPWECSSGLPKGSDVQTWRCPVCGALEWSEAVLGINHGGATGSWWCSGPERRVGFDLVDGWLVRRSPDHQSTDSGRGR